ncbi:hypothetical protein A5719_21630 [Mycolicibacterium peregrinum]|uniref:SDR family NAD(P)-dependent oxidoreductase n=1 Tax=Mycolicibacterium peregrinum TaxID=43304 RepID=UPI0007EB398C|nr:glucose 1-dehydrogenase [Mycolicibacterium peregrinum]OBF37420.1 hypothetical protein A5719_21630 [Mycolicibacterium peregrinum]
MWPTPAQDAQPAEFARSLFDLSGRVAVVTGAAGGLGSAFAAALADAGATVVCADRDGESAERIADELRAIGRHAVSVEVDVTSSVATSYMAESTLARFGRIDVLVNNAGIGDIRAVPVHRVKTEHWRQVLSVDLDGVFLCSRAVLGHMSAQQSGKIVNVASMYGLRGSRSTPMAAYASAKGAVVNFTRECALQYAADNVQINALCPGFVRTGLANGVYDDPAFVAQLESQVPMGRIAQPIELCGALLLLASSASDYMTGQSVVVDGGICAG